VVLKYYIKKKKKKLSKNPKYLPQFTQLIDELFNIFDEENTSSTTATTKNYSPSGHRTEADHDDWLNISPDEVGDIIQQKQKELEDYVKSESSAAASSTTHKAPTDNLFDFMVNDMKKFMSKMSDLEGVNFDEDELPGDISDEDEQFYREEADNDDSDEGGEEMDSIMAKMDAELNQTTLGQSFVKNKGGKTDVNLNLVKNFLSSYESQNGDPGPVINLLSQINFNK